MRNKKYTLEISTKLLGRLALTGIPRISIINDDVKIVKDSEYFYKKGKILGITTMSYDYLDVIASNSIRFEPKQDFKVFLVHQNVLGCRISYGTALEYIQNTPKDVILSHGKEAGDRHNEPFAYSKKDLTIEFLELSIWYKKSNYMK